MRAPLRLPFAILAATTLAITALRLAGELRGWPSWLFGRAAGGGGALVGIGWLLPLAGAWFGQRLAGAGARPRAGALRLVGAGLLGVALVFALATALLPVTAGTFLFVAAALPSLAVLAWRAWPELARALAWFALVQRLPVLAITALAVPGKWGTHYEQLAPGSPPMSDATRTLVLCAAQVCLWIPLTLLVGGFAGLLAARHARPRAARAAALDGSGGAS